MNKNKNDLTVIIPVFEIDKTLFTNAITSIKDQFEQPEEVLIVVVKDSDDHKIIVKEDFGELNVRVIENTKGSSFPEQMNLGVESCNTTWFIYLEQDDEMSKIWLKNIIKYKNVYSNVKIFLPIIVDVDKTSTFVGLTNQAAWAHTFSDELGVLDNQALLANQNFNFAGMAMQKAPYLEFGGVKKNIKLTFMYEFLLRMSKQANKIMIIPKLGYKHLNLREGGLFDKYRGELTPEESMWWLEKAKNEFHHIIDREIIYEKK